MLLNTSWKDCELLILMEGEIWVHFFGCTKISVSQWGTLSVVTVDKLASVL